MMFLLSLVRVGGRSSSNFVTSTVNGTVRSGLSSFVSELQLLFKECSLGPFVRSSGGLTTQ